MAADRGNEYARERHFVLSAEEMRRHLEETRRYHESAANYGNEDIEIRRHPEEEAAHYYKLAADQGNNDTRGRYTHIVAIGQNENGSSEQGNAGRSTGGQSVV
jgi:hypothetical protein